MTETRKRVAALVLAAMIATTGAFVASAAVADEAQALKCPIGVCEKDTSGDG